MTINTCQFFLTYQIYLDPIRSWQQSGWILLLVYSQLGRKRTVANIPGNAIIELSREGKVKKVNVFFPAVHVDNRPHTAMYYHVYGVLCNRLAGELNVLP